MVTEIIGLVVYIVINVYILTWIIISSKVYRKRTFLPGDTYYVYGRKYTIPPATNTINRKFRVLKEDYLAHSRELLIATISMLDKLQIEYWISGGTLLGFHRHKSIIPWDDDIDLHVNAKHKGYLLSNEFVKEIQEYNLEAIELSGFDRRQCNRREGIVRLRFRNHSCPVLDIFFVQENNDFMCKLHGWDDNTKKIKTSKKESWKKDLIYPIQQVTIDDIKLNLPAKPLEVLQTQYGENVMTTLIPQDPLYNHQMQHVLAKMQWRVRTVA